MSISPSPTRDWSAAELARLDRTLLIRVAGARPDGTLRPFVLIGHIRLGQDELIRSLNGPSGAWYRRALRTGHGAIEVDGHQLEVAFMRDSGREAEFDRALRARYGNDSGVRQMTSAAAREATLRILPLV
jgi:hypothetical protein